MTIFGAAPPTARPHRRSPMTTEMLEGPQRRPQRDGIRTVTRNTFDSLVLAGEGPIVVEFMSYGCAYCRAIEPVLQQVAEMVKARETILRVNIAVEPDLAARTHLITASRG